MTYMVDFVQRMEGAGEGGESATAFRQIEFRGDTKQYFGIWIVNLILTLVTLGVWSAWAKVRKTRYLYGNTRLDGHSFDYLAKGWTLLKGRLIVVALIGLYALAGLLSPYAQIAMALLFLPLYPWIINRSLSFSGRMTVYRNIRFHWSGTYWGTFKVTILWPLAAASTLWGLLPMATRASQLYFIRNYSYGTARFSAEAALGAYYRAFLMALMLGFGLSMAIMFVAVAGMGVVAAVFPLSGGGGQVAAEGGFSPTMTGGILAGVAGVYLVSILAFLFVSSFYHALTRNETIAGAALEGGFRFKSTLSGFRLAWISLSNLVAILFTLGMATPWATIRLWRYLCDNFWVAMGPDSASFVDKQVAAGSAFGEEFADIEGFEFGL